MAMVCEQLMVTVGDKVGRLAEMTEQLKASGLNILSLCAWVEQGTGHLMMVTDDNDKARQAVQDMVDDTQSHEVVCVKAANTPGALNEIARTLANAGIGIDMVYATAGDSPEVAIVLQTSDNAKAAELI